MNWRLELSLLTKENNSIYEECHGILLASTMNWTVELAPDTPGKELSLREIRRVEEIF